MARAHRGALARPRRSPPPGPCPRSGGSRVVSMCTVVDLPAPFGPEEAVDLARLHPQVDPVDRARALLELPDEAHTSSIAASLIGRSACSTVLPHAADQLSSRSSAASPPAPARRARPRLRRSRQDVHRAARSSARPPPRKVLERLQLRLVAGQKLSPAGPSQPHAAAVAAADSCSSATSVSTRRWFEGSAGLFEPISRRRPRHAFEGLGLASSSSSSKSGCHRFGRPGRRSSARRPRRSRPIRRSDGRRRSSTRSPRRPRARPDDAAFEGLL